MTMRSIRFLLPLMAQALSLVHTSCVYEYDDCPDDLQLQIVSDWSEAPNASPEGMAYIFLPEDGSVPWRFDFPGRTAGKVNLPLGAYRFISYNDDTANVIFSEESGYDAYEAYTALVETSDTNPDCGQAERLVRPLICFGVVLIAVPICSTAVCVILLPALIF